MSSVILFEDESQDILALQLLATTLARFISGSTVLNLSNNLKKLYLGVTLYALIIVLVPDGLVWFVNPAVFIPWIKLGAVGVWVGTAFTLYRFVNLQIETEHEALYQEQETRFYEHFFAITAHNLKNALFKIQTRLEIIKFLENKKDATLLQHMTSLETDVEDTAHMVKLLLKNSYQRIHQEGPMTIQGLAESMATTYLSNAQVKFEFTNAQSRLSPRETLALEVTIEVICSNALRHNSETFIINAGSNTLSIKDNGDGIPKELLEKLGKEVVESSSKTGTGSGLYLAKQLLQFVNWNIEIHSTLGEGTTIILNKVVDPS
jgi:signal transduction histidine kinase